jgi:hypothetical protein
MRSSGNRSYEYALRGHPLAGELAPAGFTCWRQDAQYRYGVVCYRWPLSRELIEEFDLQPLDPADPINVRIRNQARRKMLRAQFGKHKAIEGHDCAAPHIRLLLTLNMRESGAPFRVTFFEHDLPTGHCECRDFNEAVSFFIGAIAVRGVDANFIEANAVARPAPTAEAA